MPDQRCPQCNRDHAWCDPSDPCLTSTFIWDDAPSSKTKIEYATDRYGGVLAGELIGFVLGAGIVMAVIGNPYVGLTFVLAALAFHLAARKAIRG